MDEPGFEPIGCTPPGGLVIEIVGVKLTFVGRVENTHPAQVSLDSGERRAAHKPFRAREKTAATARWQHLESALDENFAELGGQTMIDFRKSHDGVSLVTREAFVAAVSVQCDGDVSARF